MDCKIIIIISIPQVCKLMSFCRFSSLYSNCEETWTQRGTTLWNRVNVENNGWQKMCPFKKDFQAERVSLSNRFILEWFYPKTTETYWLLLGQTRISQKWYLHQKVLCPLFFFLFIFMFENIFSSFFNIEPLDAALL